MMARTAEQIQADIDKVLGDAAAEQSITGPDGRSLVMRPEKDRQAALAALRQELTTVQAAAAGTTTKTRRYLLHGGDSF